MAAAEELALPPPTWLERNRQGVTYASIIAGLLVLGVIFIATTPAATWGAQGGQIGHPLALLVDPSSSQVLYAGTEAGKIYSSSDAGQTWTDLSAGLPSPGAVSALLRSADGARFVAGTSAGIYLQGADKKWSASSAGLPHGDGVDALAFAGANGAVTLAGTELHGVYRSTDGGKTWTGASGLPDGADVYGLATLPDNQTIYAALIGAGVYRSTDAGQTWGATSKGLPDKVDAFAVAPLIDSKGVVTALLAGTNAGAFRSTDGGATWVASNKGLPKTRVISYGVDPHQATQVLAGTDAGVYVTSDSGTTWRNLAQGLPGGEHIGVVTLTYSNGSGTAFAAAEKLYRYPGAGNPPQALLGRVAILGALVTAFIWLSSRQRRTMRALMPQLPADAQRPGALGRLGSANRPKPTYQPGAASHIRGGPPPASPTNSDETEDT